MPIPLSETTNRVRYQIRHFDLMGEFANAWGVIARNNIVVTAADVSPELAAHIRRHVATLHPHDRSDDRLRWRESEPTTPPTSAETTSVSATSA